jgi:uncharacterized protein (DUF1810 family)
MDASDQYDLGRFVRAQESVFSAVLAELRAGQKRTHWMWFVFPQISGLGRSAMAKEYAIASLAEARAYLAHPILGPRLTTCTTLALDVENRSVDDIFGSPDNAKFRSSMTLFARVAPEDSPFAAALQKYFGGQGDRLTLARIEGAAPP